LGNDGEDEEKNEWFGMRLKGEKQPLS
jgi:hypothetical protein